MVDKATLVETEINRVLTQYRESLKLLHLLRTLLGQVADVIEAVDDIPSFFDIDTAVGHQLTLLGQRLGWPRCHCVCAMQPVFGFDCQGVVTGQVVSGFCDDNVTWAACGPSGVSDICINDDEIYRAFLRVRRYQMLSLYDIHSLTASVQALFGPQAIVMDAGHGRVVIAPGRQLSESETALIQLYPRVLPVAPGIRIRFHFGSLTVFGFGDGWGGFCDQWLPDGAPIEAASGEALETDDGLVLDADPLTRDAEWMCEIDVKPYDCAA